MRDRDDKVLSIAQGQGKFLSPLHPCRLFIDEALHQIGLLLFDQAQGGFAIGGRQYIVRFAPETVGKAAQNCGIIFNH